MKSLVAKTLVCFLALPLTQTFAAGENRMQVAGEGGYLFAGASSGLGLGTFRLGFEQWEAGLVNPQTFAVNKLISKGISYATFGPAILISPKLGWGFFAGLGFELELIWGITVRGEMNASGAANTGQTIGSLVLGMGVHF